MKNRLSPSVLSWLRCFEATSRLGSFTQAADELCITQGAVSQQVKSLERWIERTLILRTARGLVLTVDGRNLSSFLSKMFLELGNILDQIRPQPLGSSLILNWSPSFAMAWLTPRLGDFFRAFPPIGLRVTGEFHTMDRMRMQADQVNAAIRYDLGNYVDLQAEHFLDEWLIPVASPAWVAEHQADIRHRRLDARHLLHDAAPWDGAQPHEEWMTWLDATGNTRQHRQWDGGQYFNLSQMAIAAAKAHQGIAIGRLAIVFDDLLSGKLLAPFPIAVHSKAAYYFVKTDDNSQAIQSVRDWLASQATSFHHERDQLFLSLGIRYQ